MPLPFDLEVFVFAGLCLCVATGALFYLILPRSSIADLRGPVSQGWLLGTFVVANVSLLP